MSSLALDYGMQLATIVGIWLQNLDLFCGMQGKNYIFSIKQTHWPINPDGCSVVASKTKKNILITIAVRSLKIQQACHGCTYSVTADEVGSVLMLMTVSCCLCMCAALAFDMICSITQQLVLLHAESPQ